MSYSIEKELKTLLSKQDFLKLFSHFNLLEGNQIIQSNTYYDTPNHLLKNNKTALRLRNFHFQSEWTLKIMQDQYTSLELTQNNPTLILPAPFKITSQDLYDPVILEELQSISGFDLSQLLPQIDFKTHRWIIHQPEGEYALDFCQYTLGQDYELELEVHDLQVGKENFHSLLQKLDIPFIPADKKIARAFHYR